MDVEREGGWGRGRGVVLNIVGEREEGREKDKVIK
jgi:hypothetical protein